MCKIAHTIIISAVLLSGDVKADDSATNASRNAASASTINTQNKPIPTHVLHGAIMSTESYPLTASCKEPPVTKKEFIEMMHSIVQHGDITDKAFLEKMFKIKFGHRDKNYSFNDIPSGGYYYVPILCNASQTSAGLTLNAGIKATDKSGDTYSLLTLNGLDSISLTVKEFEQRFGTHFRGAGGIGPIVQDLGKSGKNGSEMEVVYLLKPNSLQDSNNAIKGISFHQWFHANVKH